MTHKQLWNFKFPSLVEVLIKSKKSLFLRLVSLNTTSDLKQITTHMPTTTTTTTAEIVLGFGGIQKARILWAEMENSISLYPTQ